MNLHCFYDQKKKLAEANDINILKQRLQLNIKAKNCLQT